MTEMTVEQFVRDVNNEFGIYLPLSGGMGDSQPNAFILDIDNSNLIAPLEHATLHYLTLFRGHSWELHDTSMFNDEGRVFEKIRTIFSDDNANFHNFYFDITRPWNADSKPMVISGNPWFPDSKLTIYPVDGSEHENSPEMD